MVDGDHWELEPSNSAQSTTIARSQESEVKRYGSIIFVVVGAIGMFGLLAWSITNLIAGQQILQALLALAIFGSIIPSAMEDIGWLLAQRCRLYNVGIRFLKIAHKLDCTVFGLVRGGTHSMNAMRLAQVEYLRNRQEEALIWGEKALDMSSRDAWYGKFYANCVLGQIHFSANNWQRATGYLEQAQKLFDANIGATPLAILREKLRRFDVVNLDLLGQMALTADEVERAKSLFEKSYEMRRGLRDRNRLAESYREHSLGRIAFHEFKTDEASERFANALELLPADSSQDYEEQALIVEICHDSVAHGRKSQALALRSSMVLGDLQAAGLPPRLLDLAAKSITLEP